GRAVLVEVADRARLANPGSRLYRTTPAPEAIDVGHRGRLRCSLELYEERGRLSARRQDGADSPDTPAEEGRRGKGPAAVARDRVEVVLDLVDEVAMPFAPDGVECARRKDAERVGGRSRKDERVVGDPDGAVEGAV